MTTACLAKSSFFSIKTYPQKTKKAIRPLLSDMFCIIKVHLVARPGVLCMDGMAKMKGARGIWCKVHKTFRGYPFFFLHPPIHHSSREVIILAGRGRVWGEGLYV